MIALGIFAFLSGGGPLAFLWATGSFEQGRFRGIGLAIVGFLFGVGLTVMGISMYRRAARMGREAERAQEPDDDFEDED